MKLAMIGLGKMGANMVRRLIRNGHTVVGYNRSQGIVQELVNSDGMLSADTIEEAVQMLEPPRVVWVMLPAGQTTEDFLYRLAGLMQPGDVLIDGGNSNFNDTIRHAGVITQKGIDFLDVGTSGGIWGINEGYSLMIGGDKDIVEKFKPIFETLAPGKNKGWGRVGPHGSGHFTKMVHNGIEYGMMEAFAEGFEILRAKTEFSLDLHQVAQIWQYGSVVRSWLLDLTEAALAEDQNLTDIQGWVADSGEGRWTVFEAINQDIPAPVITLSLLRRFESRQTEHYAARLLAAMRNQFGGHAVKKAKE
jgi:6-phosphogluconate dehydrogenase